MMEIRNRPTLAGALMLGLIGLTFVSTIVDAKVENTSYTAADGSRVLRHEGVVDAPIAEVWKAFTTEEGVTSWMVPNAEIDFRIGGTLETSYSLEAEFPSAENIRHQFMAYLPHEMIAMRVVQCPPGLPHAELLEELWAVITFEEVAEGKTRVAIAGAGYREGEGYDAVYQFFDQGNTWTFGQLQKRFAEGPIDWNRAAEEALGSVKTPTP